MIILQPKPDACHTDHRDSDVVMGHSSDSIQAFDVIRNAAEEVICYREDMEPAPNRTNLKMNQLVPESARNLSNLVHNSVITRDALRKLADENGLVIEFDTESIASTILWLQGGGISTRRERVTLLTFIRRPIHRRNSPGPLDGELLPKEPPFKGVIKRPIAEGQWAESSFMCQLGDILILEGGESLLTQMLKLESEQEQQGHRDLCMLTNLHRTRPRGQSVDAVRLYE